MDNMANAFFPKRSETMPSENSFTRIEVALPLHQSRSTQSVTNAYMGVDTQQDVPREIAPTSTMLQIKNSIRKRSLSIKRSHPNLRGEETKTPPRPSLPPPHPTMSEHKARKMSVSSASNRFSPSPTSHPLPSAISISIPKPSSILGHFSHDSPLGSFSNSSPISSKDVFKTEKYGDIQFTMSEETDSKGQVASPVEDTDEWGFIGNSPVPAIFATSLKDSKNVGKWEQSILAVITKAHSAPLSKKLRKMLWEAASPPSLRCRIWSWIQDAVISPRPMGLYHRLASQIAVQTQPDRNMPFNSHLGCHRAFRHGTNNVQEMVQVYACHHPRTSRELDTSWIAALFMTQAFDVEQAYWLYAGLMERLEGEFRPISIRVAGVVLQQLLSQHDPQLSQHLVKLRMQPYETVVRAWYSSLFAASLPFPTVLRLLDLIILEGPLFLLRASLAIFLLSSRRIQNMRDPESVMDCLLRPPADELYSSDNLVKMAGRIALTEKTIEGMRSRVLGSLANSVRHGRQG